MTYLIVLEDGQEIEAQSVWLNGEDCIYVANGKALTINGADLISVTPNDERKQVVR